MAFCFACYSYPLQVKPLSKVLRQNRQNRKPVFLYVSVTRSWPIELIIFPLSSCKRWLYRVTGVLCWIPCSDPCAMNWGIAAYLLLSFTFLPLPALVALELLQYFQTFILIFLWSGCFSCLQWKCWSIAGNSTFARNICLIEFWMERRDNEDRFMFVHYL